MSSPLDPLNRKAYLHRWERDEEDRNITYWFCEFPKDAAHWDTLRSAENVQDILNFGVTIDSVQGGTHTLRTFEIEEFAPGHYVIHCHGKRETTRKKRQQRSPSKESLPTAFPTGSASR